MTDAARLSFRLRSGLWARVEALPVLGSGLDSDLNACPLGRARPRERVTLWIACREAAGVRYSLAGQPMPEGAQPFEEVFSGEVYGCGWAAYLEGCGSASLGRASALALRKALDAAVSAPSVVVGVQHTVSPCDGSGGPCGASAVYAIPLRLASPGEAVVRLNATGEEVCLPVGGHRWNVAGGVLSFAAAGLAG